MKNIHLIFDKSLFEVYINGGEYTFVNRIFMNTDELKAEIFAENGMFTTDMDVWSLSQHGKIRTKGSQLQKNMNSLLFASVGFS